MSFWRRPDPAYFDLLEAAGANAVHATELLHTMLADYPDENELVRQILLCEQEGDRITQAIIHKLAEGVRPPISRPAMQRLAGGIDDIVDQVEQVADCLGLYKIQAPMDPALDLARVLRDATGELVAALAALRRAESPRDAIAAVHRLESEGDRLSREAIAALFAGGVDPMVVIRWKDIFEQMEHAIDACEDVAHALEGARLGA